MTPYTVPRAAAPCDLFLDGNEGRGVSTTALLQALQNAGPMARYPNANALAEALCARWGCEPDTLLVTAGGDDALDRICRVCFQTGGELILPVPGFEMVRRYTQSAGGRVIEVPWTRALPIQAICDAATPQTKALVLTSPNNPTGSTVSKDALLALRQQLPGVLFIVDLAYAEFCDEDLTEAALALPDTLVVRTFSKAWGLAGLRVGYVMGPAQWMTRLRASGAPYAISSLSLAAAEWALNNQADAMKAFVQQVREERTLLGALLAELGFRPRPSQGNFVFAEVDDPLWLRDALAGMGIAIRAFPGRSGLENAVRITCPGDPMDFQRLCKALRTVRQPDALLFDIDGVLCDVRDSYRAAIQATTEYFGVAVSQQDIQAVKARGDANNDWVVSQRLCAQADQEVPLEAIQDVFEALVQGTEERPGLWRREQSLTDATELKRWAAGRPIAAVTGRPRRDAERFLDRAGLADCFDAVICMEDGPAKPHPAPVQLALEQLGAQSAWMFGDTPDDMRAARAAGVLPIGVAAPGEPLDQVGPSLAAAGAARVFPAVQGAVEVLR